MHSKSRENWGTMTTSRTKKLMGIRRTMLLISQRITAFKMKAMVFIFLCLILLSKYNSTILSYDSRSTIPSVFRQRPSWTIIHGWYKSEHNCREYAKEIRRVYSEALMQTKFPTSCYSSSPNYSPCIPLVHTELLEFRAVEDTNSFKKEQLLILSFLASQRLKTGPTLKLNILVSEQDYRSPPAWLSFLLNHESYGKHLQITHFQFDVLQDLPQHQIDLLSTAFNTTEDGSPLANKSDLRRYAVLYHYGGLWFDTDTIFVNDVRPLLNYDFVYVAGSRYNGAVMGANGPKSDFIRNVIDHPTYSIQENRYESSYYRFAHDLFRDLAKRDSKLFLKLSGCLFECGWGGRFQNGPRQWSDIWNLQLDNKNQVDFLVNDPDGVFSYHWHGHWDHKMKPGSLSSTVHAHYVRYLKLDPAIF